MLAAAFSVVGFAMSAKMQITSSAFANGSSIPSNLTCDAQMPPNPPLAFSGVPAKAQSLVLIMEDPDVPKNLFNAQRRFRSLDGLGYFSQEHGHQRRRLRARHQRHRQDRLCRPVSAGPLNTAYFFHLYALDTKLGDAKIANRKELGAAIKGHVIEQADLMGRYNRVKKCCRFCLKK